VEQSSLEVRERAREVEPTAVAFQETIVVQNMTSTQAAATDRPLDTAGPLPHTLTSAAIGFTPSLVPTLTPSVTPSQTPLPVPTTKVPPTEIPPTAIPPTQLPPTGVPTQSILWDPACPSSLYGATKIYVSDSEAYYQVFAKSPQSPLFTTSAQFGDPNDVKTCAFSGDGRFAAAYHYESASGGYTWIGIWDIASGARIGEKIIDGWTLDMSGAFD
jgi:hypothetical protein